MNTKNTLKTTAALLALGLLLTGCAQDGANATGAAASESPATQASSLQASETWAKAAQTGMTAAFGVLHNAGSTDIELAKVEDQAGNVIQIHETTGTGTDAKMSQLDGALKIEAGKDAVLEPGGTHLMYMDLKAPLVASETASLTLSFSDGSSTEVPFEVRNFTGAKESYEDHGGMDHDSMDHESMNHDG